MGKWEVGMFIQNMTLDSFSYEMLALLIVSGISLADKPGRNLGVKSTKR